MNARILKRIMHRHKKLVLISLVNAAVVLVVGGSITSFLYHIAFEAQRARLVETAQSWARLIESVASFDAVESKNYPGGAEMATLSQIYNAHDKFDGFGQTGEFVLAKRVENEIVFVLRHRHADLDQPKPVSFQAKFAEPMRQALQGRSGTIIDLDYRGETVLAAFEPVAILNLGLVAKIDLWEVRRPFVVAGLLTLGFGVVAVFVGTFFFMRTFHFLKRSLEEKEASEKQQKAEHNRLRQILEASPVGIGIALVGGTLMFTNTRLAEMLGILDQELVGTNFRHYHYDPSDLDLLDFSALREGRLKDLEVTLINSDGAALWTICSFGAMSYEGQPAYIFWVYDISQRKQAESALSDAHARSKAILDTAADGVITIDDRGIIDSFNKAAEVTFGYSSEDVVGRNIKMLVPAPHSERHDGYLANYRKTGESEIIGIGREVTGLRRDGSTIPLDLSVSDFHAGGQRLFTGIVRDISQRKETERTLRLTQHAVEFAVDAIIWISPKDGNITNANRTASEALGYTKEELVSLNIADISRAVTQENWRDFVAQVRASEVFIREEEYVAIDGQVIPAEVSCSLAEFEGEEFIIQFIRNISERKRAETSIRESERLLQSVINSMNDMVIVRDAQARTLMVNKTWEEMTGINAADADGSVRWESRSYEDAKTMRRILDELMRTGQATRGEFTWDLPDGPRTFLTGFYPLLDDEGKPYAVCTTATDISQRKAMEVEIRDGQARLRDAIEALPISFALFDPSERLVLFNQRLAELFPGDGSFVHEGMTHRDILSQLIEAGHEDVGSTDREAWIKERLQKDSAGSVREQTSADGRTILIQHRPTSEGGTVSIRMDITELRRAEEALRANENLLNNLFRTLPLAVFVKDDKGRFLMVNEELAGSQQIPAEEFIGKTPAEMDYGTSDEQEFIWDGEQKVLEDGELIRVPEMQLTHADGTVNWQRRTLSPLSNDVGDIVGIVGIREDITELKRAEGAVENANARLRDAIESISEGFIIFDSEDRVVICNEQFTQSMPELPGRVEPGMGFSDILGMAVSGSNFSEGEKDSWMQVQKKQHKDREGKTFLDFIQAGDRWIQSRQHVTESGDVVGIRTDVTDLITARQEAEAAAQAKSSFLAVMSHEIRTPMNGVVGMIDLLRYTGLSTEQSQMLRTVRESSFSLLQIINDILDFSKIEAGKLDLEEIPFSVRDVLESVAETLGVTTQDKEVRLSIFTDPDLPAVLIGDPVRLRQILFNLGGNAIKFTNGSLEKSASVMIRADKVETRGKKNVGIRFSIIDTGIGMTQETVDSLFRPFVQAESSTTRRFGGTGLGLSICKTLVELMGGQVGVESKEGVGSTFTADLKFPVVEQRDLEIESFDVAGLRVLALLGFEAVEEIFTRYLRCQQVTVDVVNDPEEILACAGQAAQLGTPYDVVIIGSAWNRNRQREILTELRLNPELEQIRYVVLTEDRTDHKNAFGEDTVLVHNFPLLRYKLIYGVAVAAGRASPDTELVGPAQESETRQAPSVEEAAARNELILVAEDNLTNQNVILRQLNLLGYAAEIASDGSEGFTMWETQRYALLLTDCHMPEMDGFELTDAIRMAEFGSEAKIPIVAITANALQGEAERCVEAGMNDYLSKPLEMGKLSNMLLKWLPGAAASQCSGSASGDNSTLPKNGNSGSGDSEVAIDTSSLRNVFGDDEQTLMQILAEFVEPAMDNVKEITDAYSARSAEVVGSAAHKLKSSARTVGANRLADLCIVLEKAGKSGDWREIDASFPQLDSLMEDVAKYIQNLGQV